MYMGITEKNMKGFITVFMATIVVLGAVNVEARDDHGMWSISEALNTEDAKQKLNKNIEITINRFINQRKTISSICHLAKENPVL